MTASNIVRAWEDPEYRKSLTAEELAILPANPVGEVELTDDELSEVMGAARSGASVGCNTFTCVTSRGNSNQPCNPC